GLRIPGRRGSGRGDELPRPGGRHPELRLPVRRSRLHDAGRETRQQRLQQQDLRRPGPDRSGATRRRHRAVEGVGRAQQGAGGCKGARLRCREPRLRGGRGRGAGLHRAIGGGDPERMPRIVIGVSGGLDSTHALIVAVKACDRLGLPRTHVLGLTMPGFATSDATRANAVHLMESLGIEWEEVDIRPLATQMLRDLGHPAGDGEEVYDVTFENVQAGLRTDLLFRTANHRGGIVLGTGDLSELALGWCTYGVGDQMSHYGVNAGVPKTLIQHLIRWVVSHGELSDPEADRTLLAILDTEISPELVPAREGEKIQSTQDTIGPYALHDFTLFHVLRRGDRPSKIAFLAEHAWADASTGAWPAGYPERDRVAHDLPAIRHWMGVFLRRFFQNQFKRSAIPNGPKVVAGGSLSPRGDWRMPSDASAAAWLAELEQNVPEA
ncbi:MAG: NAD(+) synthase, partial [Micrococcales bacterium]|nr:NAD(+) synthase [Micrococcales bacterium]